MIKIYFSPYIFAHTSLRTVTFLTRLTIKEKIAPFTLVLIFYFKVLMYCDSHVTFFFFYQFLSLLLKYDTVGETILILETNFWYESSLNSPTIIGKIQLYTKLVILTGGN